MRILVLNADYPRFLAWFYNRQPGLENGCYATQMAARTGHSPCGRSNMRIQGWMGRADQTTKVKGMFVRPEQIAEIGRRHPELGRLRLIVTREGEMDAMTLRAEAASTDPILSEAVTATLRGVTKLGGTVELVPIGALPNDGKVIFDER